MLNMRGRSLPSARCLGPTSFHHVSTRPSEMQAKLAGMAIATRRTPFSSAPQHFTQDSKAFTRYTLPKSVKIEKASDMTSAKVKRARTAYVALGSNLGDRIAEIEKACLEMDARGIRVLRTSSLWETEPMYYAHQDRFVNGVCEVSCCLDISTFSTRLLNQDERT